MKKLSKKILGLLMLLTITVSAMGIYVFKILEASDGLTCSQINWITKDSRGYMWFGTPAGLFRYDGYIFKKFQSDSNDGSSLPDSYIYKMYEGLNGDMWIQTAQGICVYHPQTESFDTDENAIFSRIGIDGVPTVFGVTPRKELWMYVPGQAVYMYNMHQSLLYEYPLNDDGKSVPLGNVVSMNQTNIGMMLVYDDGKLVHLAVVGGKQKIVSINDSLKYTIPNKTLKVFIDSQDNIWLYGQGTLNIFNKETLSWDSSLASRLGLTRENTDRSVNDVQEDNNGNIWIGTDQIGLQRYDINTGELELVQPLDLRGKENIDGPIRVQSVFVDATNLVWVGTQRRGVAYWGEGIHKFHEDRIGDITAICEDVNGRLIYGTSDRGLMDYGGQLASLSVSSLVTSDDGDIWVGSPSMGITRIGNGTTTIYSEKKDDGKTLIDDHINDLCKDRNGNIWIATTKGLQVYSKLTNQFSAYTKENGKLQSNNITALACTRDNRLLIGSANGLIIMNPRNGEAKLHTGNRSNLKLFSNNYITQVYEDSRRMLWIGTREGLNILNMANDELSYITESNGLCNNNICGITEDKNGNIWVTTSNGASRIVVERNRSNDSESTFGFSIYNYNTKDGLMSNEFSDGSILTTHDGKVYLGGKYGSSLVIDKSNGASEKLESVILTQLFIGDEEVQIGQSYDHRVILTQSLNESPSINLTSSQNTFTIKFAVGNYNQSERLQFIYWMQGLDESWHNGDPMKHGVTFKGLSSGHYTLHVKAVSADGAVSKEERVIDINISAPWWMSWRMIVVYVLSVLLIFFLWRFGMKKVSDMWKRQKSIITELQKQRDETKQAGDDLRHPMARMTGIIGKLAELNTSIEHRELVNSLHFELLQLITRISEMQITLEDPLQKAEVKVDSALSFDENGSLLLQGTHDELTYNMNTSNTKALPTKGYRVLVVDDNEDFLRFIQARMGDVFNLSTHNNTAEALEIATQEHVDIIMSKHDMPDMSGSELCDRVKVEGLNDKIKFVIVTEKELTPMDIRRRHITISADDYLVKPFNVNEALNHFNKLLGIDLDMTKLLSNSIKGEKKLLEQENASMTRADMDYTLVEDTIVDAEVENGTQIQEVESDGVDLLLSNILGDKYMRLSIMDRQFLRDVNQYVLQNMIRGQLNIDAMSQALKLPRIQFFHRMRDIAGCTPADFVKEIRLQHACDLLSRTDISVSDVAINTGYITTENFTNIFREKMGMSPIEYRASNSNSQF